MDVGGVYKPTYHWAHHLIDLIVLDSEPLSFPTCSQAFQHVPMLSSRSRVTYMTCRRASVSTSSVCMPKSTREVCSRGNPSNPRPWKSEWVCLEMVYGHPIPGNFNSKRIMNHRLLGYPEFVVVVFFSNSWSQSLVGISRVAGCLYRCHTALKSKAEKSDFLGYQIFRQTQRR